MTAVQDGRASLSSSFVVALCVDRTFASRGATCVSVFIIILFLFSSVPLSEAHRVVGASLLRNVITVCCDIR